MSSRNLLKPLTAAESWGFVQRPALLSSHFAHFWTGRNILRGKLALISCTALMAVVLPFGPAHAAAPCGGGPEIPSITVDTGSYQVSTPGLNLLVDLQPQGEPGIVVPRFETYPPPAVNPNDPLGSVPSIALFLDESGSDNLVVEVSVCYSVDGGSTTETVIIPVDNRINAGCVLFVGDADFNPGCQYSISH